MVRVGTPSAVARPAWYDRNPIHRQNVYDQSGITPHTITSRWSYVVPAGKKAFVDALHLRILRGTAASTVNRVRAQITVVPSGGSSGSLFYAEIMTNNVGDRDAVSVGQGIMLLAGDTIAAATSDISTGGSIDYLLAAKITEFDA